MEYFEVEDPGEDGVCSDKACPCPEVRIPRGTGYLYISQELVDFRKDARSLQDVERKIHRMEQQAVQKIGGPATIMVDPDLLVPILVCEQGAKLRGLDLEVAAADAKYLWSTGLAPLRATPLAGSKENEIERKEPDEKTKIKQPIGTFKESGKTAKKWWQFWK